MSSICRGHIGFLVCFLTWMLCKAFPYTRHDSTLRIPSWVRRNVLDCFKSTAMVTRTGQPRWIAPPRPTLLANSLRLKFTGSDSTGKSNRLSWIGSPRGGSLLFSSSSTNLVQEPESVQKGDSPATTHSPEPIRIPSILIADDGAFVKSLPDKRQYRSIRLGSNLLQVLLISDPNTDTEAAAVHLRSGHFHDPINRAGLAHFHEHCLFLGTNKYPAENEYEGYLNKHGGFSNAYTDMEDTNYYFCVAPLNHGEEEEEQEEEEEGENDELIPDSNEDKSSMPTTVSSALSGALDRFAQFFISPLFNSDSIERELRAVDSEYSNSLNSDSWRLNQLLKSSSDPRHPFSKFGCGNYYTLTDGGNIHETLNLTKKDIEKFAAIPFHGGTSPREALIQFWTEHYHAANMKLVVLGRGTLDDLQAVVENTFGSVRANNGLEIENSHRANSSFNTNDLSSSQNSEVIFSTENSHYGVSAFHSSKNLGVICEIIPVKEKRTIQLLFATPPMQDPLLRKSLPQRLISHILGHESPGSLHHLLSGLGYINSLSSGTAVDTRDFSLFSLNLGMTPKGMANTEEVLDLCFQWIDMIRALLINSNREDGSFLLRQYHEELKRISQVSFQFRENGDATSFASGAAETLYLFEENPQNLLRGDSFDSEYNEDVTRAFLQRLQPENVLITITDSDLKGKAPHLKDLGEASWQKEPLYGAMFRNYEITESLRQKWKNLPSCDSRLRLPGLNQFIATDFSLRCDHAKSMNETQRGTDADAVAIASPPIKVLETPLFRLWHKMDSTFRVPKTMFNVYILTPNVYRSPRAITAGRLFQKVLNDDLNSFVYDAVVAGNSYRFSVIPSGFTLSLVGYSEKMPAVLEAVTSRIMSLVLEMKQGPEQHPTLGDKYNKAVQNLARETKNFRLDSPLAIASYNSRMLLESPVWHIEQYVAEMEGEVADKNPLTMKECALLVEEALNGRVAVDILCMGNANETDAHQLVAVLQNHILKNCLPLSEDEIPRFRSNQLPTKVEALSLFKGFNPDQSLHSLILEDVAVSKDENNNAVEITLQVSSDYKLGFVGLAVLELICHLAYPSAFNKLRTQEQLGYMVSAHARKSVGNSRGLSIEVQSNTALPEYLEERCEAWLEAFRQELVDMPVERLEMEAAAVVSQLLERDTKLSQEVARAWDDILSTTALKVHNVVPPFDQYSKLAEVLTTSEMESTIGPQTGTDLKQLVLDFFDKHFSNSSTERRSLVSRSYGFKYREQFEANKGKPSIVSSYSEIQRVKQYLPLLPNIPYWIKL